MIRTISEIHELPTLERNTQIDHSIRMGGMILAEAFTVFSLNYALSNGDRNSVPVCIAAMGLVLLPEIGERLFRCRIRTDVYILCILYALGSMAGDAYQLYDRIPMWDKLLHTLGGIHFAMLGAYLPRLLNKENKNSVLMCAVFAVCFSIAVSAVWEFYEFGMDQLFGRDMQRDTFIAAMDSRLLSDATNAVGSIRQIESVTVNGVELGGYIDIGLIDTMMDMLVETFGALIYAAVYLISKGERPAFVPAEMEDAA